MPLAAAKIEDNTLYVAQLFINTCLYLPLPSSTSLILPRIVHKVNFTKITFDIVNILLIFAKCNRKPITQNTSKHEPS